MKIANFCEVSLNAHSGHENTQNEHMQTKLRETQEMTVPQLIARLDQATTKKEALDACLSMLSTHGLLSGVGEREGLWAKLQQWRGR